MCSVGNIRDIPKLTGNNPKKPIYFEINVLVV